MGLFSDNIRQDRARNFQAEQDRAALNTLLQMNSDAQDGQGEQAALRGKQANAIRNVIAQYSDDPNVGHAVKAMSVDQLEGILHAYSLNSAMQKQDVENQRTQAETAWYQQRSQESAGEGEALSRFASEFQSALPRYAPPPVQSMGPMDASAAPGLSEYFNRQQPQQPATPDQVRAASLAAMANMGRTNPRMAGVMIKALLPSMTGQEDLTTGTYNVPSTGATFVTRGKSILPAGFNQTQVQGIEPIPQISNGKLIGWSVVDPRGHGIFHAAPAESVVDQMTDSDGNIIPGYYMDSAGHKINSRTAMEQQGFEMTQDAEGKMTFGPMKKPPAAGYNGKKSVNDVKVGEVYNGYRWKGGDKKDKANWEPVK